MNIFPVLLKVPFEHVASFLADTKVWVLATLTLRVFACKSRGAENYRRETKERRKSDGEVGGNKNWSSGKNDEGHALYIIYRSVRVRTVSMIEVSTCSTEVFRWEQPLPASPREGYYVRYELGLTVLKLPTPVRVWLLREGTQVLSWNETMLET